MERPKLKAVIKTLVPLILAELKNLRSSSSSSSHAAKRRLKTKLSQVKPDFQISEPGSCRQPQVGTELLIKHSWFKWIVSHLHLSETFIQNYNLNSLFWHRFHLPTFINIALSLFVVWLSLWFTFHLFTRQEHPLLQPRWSSAGLLILCLTATCFQLRRF